MPATPASRAAIATDLRRLGLAAGALVMVHASLRAHEHRLTVSSLQDDLDADLRLARRRHSQPEIAAIRSLKSALANAEAVPVPDRSFELVEGSADVPRRRLAAADIAAVIEAEIAERQRAIEVYRTTGADTTALELELASLQRYQRPR